MHRTPSLETTPVAMSIMVRPVLGPLRHPPSEEMRSGLQVVKPFRTKALLPLADQTPGADNAKRSASEIGMHMLIWPTQFKLHWETCTMNIRETSSPALRLARLTMDIRVRTNAMIRTGNPMVTTFVLVHHRVDTVYPSSAVLLLGPGDSVCLDSDSRT